MKKVNSSDFYRWGIIAAENNKIENSISGKILSTDIDLCSRTSLQIANDMPGRVVRIIRRTYDCSFCLNGDGLNLYSLVYVYNGRLRIDCGNISKTVSEGTLIVLPAEAVYKISQCSNIVNVFMLFCAGGMVESYGKILNGSSIKYFFESPEGEFFESVEKIMFLINGIDVLSNVRISDALSKIFTRLIESPEFNSTITTKKYNPVFNKHVQYLSSHLGEKLNVKKLADKLKMSEASYHRFIKKYAGDSPYVFITKLRLNKARELLSSTRLQVKTVAITVGIPSFNHFSEKFKVQFGILPSEFRESLG